MKQLKYILATLLVITGAGNIVAQTIEDGTAFYIYRNDGDFNGFFYDEVEEMRYSKIDLNNEEHDEFVVQEVVTADSTYRIPLAAIDSVGFVQPEVKFAPKVRHMDMLGMTPYVTSVSGLQLTFSKTMPPSLSPKVDDVLIGFTGMLENYGFGGRVTQVRETDSGIEVTCAQLTKMSEIFKQLISVEHIGVDENTNQVQHRVAGYNQVRAAESGGLTANLINISANLHIPFDTEVSVGTSLDAGVSFKTKLAMVYHILNDDYWIRASLASDYSLSLGFTLKLSGSGDKAVPLVPGPLNAIKFPAVCPFFEVRPAPSLGIRWAAEASASVQLPVKSGGTHQSIKIASDDPNFISYNGDSYSKSNGISSFFSESDVNFRIKGTLQAGIKSVIGIHTNSWFEKVFDVSFATDVWIGPKIEAEVVVDRGFFEEDDGPYTFRDNRFSLSPLSLDWETYASVNTLLTEPKHYTFADGSIDLMASKDFYMFPSFSNFDVNHDEKNGMLVARWSCSHRQVFWSSDPGIVVYRKELPNVFIAADYAGSLSFGDVSPESKEMNYSTKRAIPGYYFAAPALRAFGDVYPVRSMKKQFKVPVYLTVPKTVTAPGKGGTFTIPAETNGELRGSNVRELPANGFLKKETSAIVTAYAPNDDMEPVTETVTIVQEGSGEGVQDVVFTLDDGILEDYGFHTYPGTTPNVRVEVNGTRAIISGSYSGTPLNQGDDHYLSYDITMGDEFGNFHTIHVPSSESVSWDYNFVVDLNETLDNDAMMALIREAPGVLETSRHGNPVYTLTTYYLASDQDKGITEESSGWGTKKAALSAMTMERRYLWSYDSRQYDDFDSPIAEPAKIVMQVPVRYKIISGYLSCSVSGNAQYRDMVNESINRSASITIKDGYMHRNADTWWVGRGKANCRFSSDSVSEDKELDYHLEVQ